MREKQRIISGVLVVLLIATLFSACGSGSSAGTQGNSSSSGNAGSKETTSTSGSSNEVITGSTEYYRTIQVDRARGQVAVSRTGSSTMEAYEGLTLYGGDEVSIEQESDMVMTADSDKHLYAEENTRFALESSGTSSSSKTRIMLADGGVLCRLENKLGPDETFEVETPAGTMAIRGTVFRVKIIHMNGAQYTLIEVFEGVVEVTIKETGETVTLQPGEAALIKAPDWIELVPAGSIESDDNNGTGNSDSSNGNGTTSSSNGNGTTGSTGGTTASSGDSTTASNGTTSSGNSESDTKSEEERIRFVLNDEIDKEYWRTKITVDFEVSSGGSGSPILTIPYEKLPKATLEELISYCEDGEELCVTKDVLENVLTTDHNYIETVIIPATCLQNGHSSYECTLCGHTYEGDTVGDHIGEIITGTPATCIATGLTDGTVCTVCGKVLEGQEEIPALGHTVVTDYGYSATCTANGLTTGSHCSVCGAVLTSQQTISMTGHTVVQDAAVAATCTTAGSTAGSHCSVCGETLEGREEISALGHTIVTDAGYEATCTSTGLSTGSHCSVCNTVIAAQQTIPKKPHTSATDAAVAATCTTTGLTEGSHCTVCGEVITAQTTVAALGHTVVTDAAVAATCTTSGLTEGSHCSVCNTVLTAQTTVAALGHTEVTDAAVAATCTETGLTEGSHCSTCGTVLTAQKTVAALGHTEVTDAAVAATCTATGLTEGSHCSVCNTVLTAQTTIAALGHKEGEPVESNPVDKTMCYHETISCTVCGETISEQDVAHEEGEPVYTETEQIIVDDSNPDIPEESRPTETIEGHDITITCLRCKQVISTTFEEHNLLASIGDGFDGIMFGEEGIETDLNVDTKEVNSLTIPMWCYLTMTCEDCGYVDGTTIDMSVVVTRDGEVGITYQNMEPSFASDDEKQDFINLVNETALSVFKDYS